MKELYEKEHPEKMSLNKEMVFIHINVLKIAAKACNFEMQSQRAGFSTPFIVWRKKYDL